MHIAILTTVHSPLNGRVYYKEAIGLSKAGYQITLFAPWEASAEAITRRDKITYFPLFSGNQRYFRPIRWLQLMINLMIHRADVWLLQDPELLPLAIIWKALFARRTRIIYDIHEDVPKDILYYKTWIPKEIRRPLSKFVEKVEHWGITKCDLILSVSEVIAKRVEPYAKKVLIIQNYPVLDNGQLTPIIHQSKIRVRAIHAGSLTEPYGIREIVQAMNELQDCDIELLLMGILYPPSYEQEIRALAGPNVVIAGRVSFEEVPQFLRESDIGMMCSLPYGQTNDSFPVKFFEYMRVGLPIVASNIPLWRQAIEEIGCGIIVDPRDPKNVASAIRKLADDPKLRQQMGEAGVRAVKGKYSWEKELEKLIAELSKSI